MKARREGRAASHRFIPAAVRPVDPLLRLRVSSTPCNQGANFSVRLTPSSTARARKDATKARNANQTAAREPDGDGVWPARAPLAGLVLESPPRTQRR